MVMRKAAIAEMRTILEIVVGVGGEVGVGVVVVNVVDDYGTGDKF
jgi:hypothetical protein